MNRRRPVAALSRDDVRTLMHLWLHSKKMGYDLNVFISVCIDRFDDLTDAEKAAARGRILNNVGQFARRHEFPIYFVWTREIDADGRGEHFHILVHLPPKRRASFCSSAANWLRDGEIDLRPADYRTQRASDGRVHNVLLYIAKQMSPQACFFTLWRRKKGGVVVGARWGCSRSLTAEKRSTLRNFERRRNEAKAIRKAMAEFGDAVETRDREARPVNFG